VYNDILGEIVIGNCFYNEAPDYYPNAFNSLNGSASLTFSDGSTCDFLAILNIYNDDSKRSLIIKMLIIKIAFVMNLRDV
jgi:hypothetical protein